MQLRAIFFGGRLDTQSHHADSDRNESSLAAAIYRLSNGGQIGKRVSLVTPLDVRAYSTFGFEIASRAGYTLEPVCYEVVACEHLEDSIVLHAQSVEPVTVEPHCVA